MCVSLCLVCRACLLCQFPTGLGPLLCGVAPDAACSVAVVDRSMPSPVVRRLYPIQGRPPGHWKRYRSHRSHVRPAIPQLRRRCASYGGSTGASARAASADWLPAHRTLRTTTTDMLEARASCCFCSRCCMLPSAPCSRATSSSTIPVSLYADVDCEPVPSTFDKNSSALHAAWPRAPGTATELGLRRFARA